MSEANPIVEWRDVQGFPGYQVSNYGEVRSAAKPGVHHFPMTLKPEPGHEGHLRVRLFRDKKVHRVLVHRLVLETFVGPCPPHLKVCRHIDNNSQNNFVGNLAWGTQQENMADKKVHGTEQKGERHPRSILKEDQVREIKGLLAQGFGQTEIGRRYGVSNFAIHDIATGHAWGFVKLESKPFCRHCKCTDKPLGRVSREPLGRDSSPGELYGVLCRDCWEQHRKTLPRRSGFSWRVLRLVV